MGEYHTAPSVEARASTALEPAATVLIIDDEPIVHEMMDALLLPQGYSMQH